MVRVTGGEWKGRGWEAPRSVRVTGAKVRQALFNILGSLTPGARMVDAFAGSGAVGIEALSRGASFVAFIESDDEAAWAIRGALERCSGERLPRRWRIVQRDADAGLRQLARDDGPFDIIFCDPPYADEAAKKVLNTVEGCAMLARTGWLIIEHHRRAVLPSSVGPLRQSGQRRYGGTVLSFYQSGVP